MLMRFVIELKWVLFILSNSVYKLAIELKLNNLIRRLNFFGNPSKIKC